MAHRSLGPVARAAAPVRLDFAGAWTDVPPFSTDEGGAVVTAAISLFARAEADSLCRAPLPGPVRLTAIDDNHLMLLHREEATAAVVDAVLRGLEPRR